MSNYSRCRHENCKSCTTLYHISNLLQQQEFALIQLKVDISPVLKCCIGLLRQVIVRIRPLPVAVTTLEACVHATSANALAIAAPEESQACVPSRLICSGPELISCADATRLLFKLASLHGLNPEEGH